MSSPLAHAILGASGAKKWSTCTMAAAMEKGLSDEVSEFNREGTCAHAVCEARIAYSLDNGGKDLGPEAEALLAIPDYDEFFDQEFDEFCDEYVCWVLEKIEALRNQHGAKNVTVMLEQRLRFDRWVPEGFGTGDVVIIVPGRIIVIDLKFGRGVFVDGEDNAQLKLYGLGAWSTYDVLYDFDDVEVWIHQPRKSNVSGEVIDVKEIRGLLTWADEFIKPRAAIAWAAYNGDRTDARFHPGDHCNSGFCKARFNCAARARYQLELGDMPQALDEPDTLTVDQLEEITERADGLAKWAGDVAEFLLKQADLGQVALKKFKLGYGRSNRQITDEAKAASVLILSGFAADDVYKAPALANLGTLEKLVGKTKLATLLKEFIVKPTGAKKLVPIGDAAPAAQPRRQSAEEAFG